MQIKIRFFATLREGRGKKTILDIEDEITPRKIFKMFGIKHEDVVMLLINGRDGNFDKSLMHNDVVSIFPPVGGG